MAQLAEYVNGIPNLSGAKEPLLKSNNNQQIFLPESGIDWDNVKSAFAIALHMHQPIIPNPDQPLNQAEEISYLKHMMDHPNTGDNHNASVFRNCKTNGGLHSRTS